MPPRALPPLRSATAARQGVATSIPDVFLYFGVAACQPIGRVVQTTSVTGPAPRAGAAALSSKAASESSATSAGTLATPAAANVQPVEASAGLARDAPCKIVDDVLSVSAPRTPRTAPVAKPARLGSSRRARRPAQAAHSLRMVSRARVGPRCRLGRSSLHSSHHGGTPTERGSHRGTCGATSARAPTPCYYRWHTDRARATAGHRRQRRMHGNVGVRESHQRTLAG